MARRGGDEQGNAHGATEATVRGPGRVPEPSTDVQLERTREELEAALEEKEALAERLRDLEDGDEDQGEVEDPIELVRKAIGGISAGHPVDLYVYRIVEGSPNQLAGTFKFSPEGIEDYPEAVAKKCQGGDYKLVWRYRGKIVVHDAFSVDPAQYGVKGNAASVGGVSAQVQPTQHSPEFEALKARNVQLEREKEEAAERAKLQETVQAAIAPLVNKIQALEKTPAPPPPDPVDQFAKMKAVFDTKEPKAPKEIETLTAKVSELATDLKHERAARRKAEVQAELAARDKKIEDLERRIAESEARPRGLASGLKSEMKDLVELQALMNFGKAPEDRNTGFLDGIFSKLEKKLSPAVTKKIEEKLTSAFETALDAQSVQAATESPQEFAAWLNTQSASKFAFVADAASVTAIYNRFPAHMARLAACTERGQFVDLLVACGYPRPAVEAQIDATLWPLVAEKLGQLRATRAANPAPPPPSKPAPPAPPPPKDDEREESSEDEGEEDEEEDGEDSESEEESE